MKNKTKTPKIRCCRSLYYPIFWVHLSIYPLAHLFSQSSAIHVSIHVSFRASIHPSLHLYIHPSLHKSIKFDDSTNTKGHRLWVSMEFCKNCLLVFWGHRVRKVLKCRSIQGGSLSVIPLACKVHRPSMVLSHGLKPHQFGVQFPLPFLSWFSGFPLLPYFIIITAFGAPTVYPTPCWP